MTIRIDAPFGGPISTMFLPNPELGNTEGLDISMTLSKSMDNTPYSYVKTSPNSRLSYSFEHIGRGKLQEVLEFVKAHIADDWLLTDYKGKQWKVKLLEDVEISTDARSYIISGERGEAGSFNLSFLADPL